VPFFAVLEEADLLFGAKRAVKLPSVFMDGAHAGYRKRLVH